MLAPDSPATHKDTRRALIHARWAIVVPGVLMSGELEDLNLTHKTGWLLCVGNLELHVEPCSAVRILIDRK